MNGKPTLLGLVRLAGRVVIDNEPHPNPRVFALITGIGIAAEISFLQCVSPAQARSISHYAETGESCPSGILEAG